MIKTPVDNYHVMPVGDLKEHLESVDCWCNPDIEDVFTDKLPPYCVVHKAVDGREKREDGWKTKQKVKIDTGYIYNLRSMKGS